MSLTLEWPGAVVLEWPTSASRWVVAGTATAELYPCACDDTRASAPEWVTEPTCWWRTSAGQWRSRCSCWGRRRDPDLPVGCCSNHPANPAHLLDPEAPAGATADSQPIPHAPQPAGATARPNPVPDPLRLAGGDAELLPHPVGVSRHPLPAVETEADAPTQTRPGPEPRRPSVKGGGAVAGSGPVAVTRHPPYRRHWTPEEITCPCSTPWDADSRPGGIHCVTCHHHFKSAPAFGMHQQRPGVCRDPGSVRDVDTGAPLLRRVAVAGIPVWA